MKKISLSIGENKFEAELYDTPTANAIYEDLPIEGNISTWGKEIYFMFGVQCPLEDDASEEVGVGELAYWPGGPAFCIFWGPTPASLKGEPRAVSEVNIFGKITSSISVLDSLSSGLMKVEKI